jgi:O-antigen/teichoic acid export membrane protein
MSKLFAQNTAYGVAAGIVTSLGRFATTIIIARLLGVHDTGVFYFVLWIAGMVGAVIDLGMYPALTRYLPEISRHQSQDSAKDLAARLLGPFAAVACVAFVILSLVGAWAYVDPDFVRRFGLEPSPTLWILIGLLCASQALSNFGIGYLQGMQRFHVFAALCLGSTVIQLLVCAVGAAFFGVIGAVIGSIAATLLHAGVCLQLVRRRANVPTDLLRRVSKFSRFAWASGLAAAFIWARPEVAFVQYYWGNEAVGLYSVGYTLASLAAQGPALLTAGLMPFFSENAGPQGHAEVVKMVASGTRLLAFMVLPMCFVTSALVPEFLPLLYGREFSGAAPAAMVLVASAALWANMPVLTAAIAGRERNDFTFSANVAGAVLMLGISYILIPVFGILGAALARTLAQVLMLGAMVWFVVRSLQYELPFSHLLRLFVAAVGSAIVAKLVSLLLPSLAGLVLALGASLLSYLLFVRTLRAIPATDLNRLKTVLDRFPGGFFWFVMPVLARVLHR